MTLSQPGHDVWIFLPGSSCKFVAIFLKFVAIMRLSPKGSQHLLHGCAGSLLGCLTGSGGDVSYSETLPPNGSGTLSNHHLGRLRAGLRESRAAVWRQPYSHPLPAWLTKAPGLDQERRHHRMKLIPEHPIYPRPGSLLIVEAVNQILPFAFSIALLWLAASVDVRGCG